MMGESGAKGERAHAQKNRPVPVSTVTSTWSRPSISFMMDARRANCGMVKALRRSGLLIVTMANLSSTVYETTVSSSGAMMLTAHSDRSISIDARIPIHGPRPSLGLLISMF